MASWVGLALQPGWVSRCLAARWLCGLGAISYGVYLLHEPILGFGTRAIVGDRVIENAGDLLITVSLTSGTIIAAWLSWRFFEGPILNAVRKQTYAKVDNHA
jgi:peptidoglycan/LPS O-acetylase OafA/YrhL